MATTNGNAREAASQLMATKSKKNGNICVGSHLNVPLVYSFLYIVFIKIIVVLLGTSLAA